MRPTPWHQFVERLSIEHIATPAELRGCSDAELAALEARYRVRLPNYYRLYLQTMGHASGRLFATDHLAVRYPDVFRLTGDLPRDWVADGTPPPATFELPADALVICARLGEQFEFIRCADERDSAVWYFNSWDWQTRESHPSVLAWLDAWREEAQRALATGYFEQNLGGTSA
jgi:hypothetical protein